MTEEPEGMNGNTDDNAWPWKAMIKFGAGLVVASVLGLAIVIGGILILHSCAN